MGANKNAALDKRDAAKQKQLAKNTKPSWRGFVDCELSAQDKVKLKDLLAASPQVHWDWVDDYLYGKYKLSLSFDAYNGAYIASMTCNSADDPNQGLSLTGRGGSMSMAIASVWYKSTVILEGDWSNNVSTGRRAMAADDVG